LTGTPKNPNFSTEKDDLKRTNKLTTPGLDHGRTNIHLPTDLSGIKSCLEAIERSSFSDNENNFNDRIEAIDFIEDHVLDPIEWLLQKTNQPDQLTLLKHHAQTVKSRLEEINTAWFASLRENIRDKKYAASDLRDLLHEYVGSDLNSGRQPEVIGYDNLDILLNGLCSFLPMPEMTGSLEPEMVYYQKTPGRIILELVEKAQFTKGDIFFDLGSGLGQVAILVNLLSGVRAKGVEFDPAFCHYSNACATQLNLSNVTFINADAREANYSEGTVFFMYTPFEGNMLQTVLEILKHESQTRKIRIFTYGPCITKVAEQPWLDFLGTDINDIHALGVFSSR
jgi:hypothetical protein